ncbi:hypothetical protein F4774DRAFT_334422 [Daldinia eschscholtzii]|nr:hypothetical protein F4774DRAFT_334422 [Daldinia eschscholtzii]
MSDEDDESIRRQGGYLAAAAWLARDADNETLVFRKFDKLSAVNLLYLQSEIIEIEKRLDDTHLHIIHGHDMDLKDAASTWETLVAQCQSDKPSQLRQDAQDRMALIRELRAKLKEYHEALVLQNQIAQMRHPEKRVLAAVRYFFERPHPILGGKAKTFLNNAKDLIALKAPTETDVLSSFLRRHWASERELARDGVSHFTRFSDVSIAVTVNLVTIVVAAVFLIGPIIGLNFARNPTAKLVMISFFMVAFAASIGLITTAKRSEIFAATAAYAAVLVVFVSNGDFLSDKDN